jgi:hypothetical protein
MAGSTPDRSEQERISPTIRAERNESNARIRRHQARNRAAHRDDRVFDDPADQNVENKGTTAI